VAEVLRKSLVALATVALAAGCAAGGGPAEPVSQHSRTETAEVVSAPVAARCTPGRLASLGNRREAYAARAVGSVAAVTRPGGRRIRAFGPRNVNGVATVFGVRGVVRDRGCKPVWYRVQLPIRPNGATGWIRAEHVLLLLVHTRIEVDLSQRRVDFFRDGRRVLGATAGVGSAATPTPTGRYYVNQRLLASDPSGPFGPGAIGISAFSPVLTGWVQGGPIAIHGTNDPSSIGRPVTNRCLRITNDRLVRMFSAMPEGTPVIVRP
jgi:lipoprotein-anchoring transpeptidase ErfK/SrfK